MFLGLLDPDPDPLVRGIDPDPSIIKQKSQENPWGLLFCDFLSLKNYVNEPSKSNMPKNLCHGSATLLLINLVSSGFK
jgi:hypothetical protein